MKRSFLLKAESLIPFLEIKTAKTNGTTIFYFVLTASFSARLWHAATWIFNSPFMFLKSSFPNEFHLLWSSHSILAPLLGPRLGQYTRTKRRNKTCRALPLSKPNRTTPPSAPTAPLSPEHPRDNDHHPLQIFDRTGRAVYITLVSGGEAAAFKFIPAHVAAWGARGVPACAGTVS